MKNLDDEVFDRPLEGGPYRMGSYVVLYDEIEGFGKFEKKFIVTQVHHGRLFAAIFGQRYDLVSTEVDEGTK